MVNVSLWEAVQQQYPVEVQKKLNDEDDGLEERIVNQGFTRVPIQEGEIKKEFDDMLVTLRQEHEELELHSLEIAKRLQEEENANQQSKKVLNEQLVQSDMELASSIQETIENELQQEETLLKESDMQIAMELQNRITSGLGEIFKDMPNTKRNMPKTGPLDKLFAKLNSKNSEVQCINEENVEWNSHSPSSSFNPSTSTDLTAVSANEDLECCSCGRLQDFDSQKPPCQFCTIQIESFEKISTQQKMDFLIAKDLEKKLNMENVKDYNLRKRSTSTTPVSAKKIRKLSKGQLTLKQVLD